MSVAPVMLTGSQLAAYIRSGASSRGLDPNAVLAVASAEGGLSGAVGDNSTSFGPFQLHVGGALPSSIAAQGSVFARLWANSKAGVDYALNAIAQVAGGKTGMAAVDAIVTGFERPADGGAGDEQRAASYLASNGVTITVPRPTGGAGGAQDVSVGGTLKHALTHGLLPNPLSGITDMAHLVAKVLGDPEATLGHALLYLVLLFLGVALIFEGFLRMTGSSYRPSNPILELAKAGVAA